MPAMIDYIVALTKYEKVVFVGHSLANLAIYSGITDNLEYYQKRLSLMINLAPPLKFSSTESPVSLILINNFPVTYFFYVLFSWYEVMPL